MHLVQLSNGVELQTAKHLRDDTLQRLPLTAAIWKVLAIYLSQAIPQLLCIPRLRVTCGHLAITKVAHSLAMPESSLTTRFLPFSRLPISMGRMIRTKDLGKQSNHQWRRRFNRGLL